MNGNRPARASFCLALVMATGVVGCGKILGFEDFTDGRGGAVDGLPDATTNGSPDATTNGPLAEAGSPDGASGRDGGAGDAGTDSACGGGTCPACAAGLAACGTACINVSGTDANNCGGCGLTCGGAACVGGRCQPTTVATAPADIRSIAVLNGLVFYTTATGIYNCVDAACSSASGLSAPNAVLKARNSLVYALSDTNVFRYTSSGTVLSQAAFPFNSNFSFAQMDVAPNGMLYAIQKYDLVRLDTSNLSAGTTVVTLITGNTDESVQLFSIAANDDVFTTLDGLGGATRRCLGTTCSEVARDPNYVHVVNQHLAYTTNSPSPVNYCSYNLITCSQIMTGVTSYVADDGQVIFVNANNNLVALEPLKSNKQTVILTNLTGSLALNLSSNQVAFDGDYIYWVGTGRRTVQRTRKY